MRLAVRAFLWSFLPLAMLLAGSFLAVERTVVGVVRDALRISLRNHQESVGRMEAQREQQSRRWVHLVAENAALKAGLQLLLAEPGREDARLTVEDQLGEIAGRAEIDLLAISGADGTLLAAADGTGGSSGTKRLSGERLMDAEFLVAKNALYRLTTVPISQADEMLALVTVGQRQDLSRFTTPVVLLRDGEVMQSTVPGVDWKQLRQTLPGCRPGMTCEVALAGVPYFALAAPNEDGRYRLLSLVNVDASLQPVLGTLRRVFAIAAGGVMLAAVVIAFLSSVSLVKPIGQVVAHLHASEHTGTLTALRATDSGVDEIRELVEGFNRAAGAIEAGKERLHSAYVEFVGSLASALDARDPYTAGHSSRVCEYACAIGQAMGLAPGELEDLRIGALLHDIGKIGVPDAILRKTGRLTAEEFDQIKEHPGIGRRILEGVQGFAPYLDVVELHHENWDGTGYPHGLRGEAVPLSARIVHVADAYDAMTSDRPYRRGMRPEVALGILAENAWAQFDGLVVQTFILALEDSAGPAAGSLGRLAVAIGEAAQPGVTLAAGRSKI